MRALTDRTVLLFFKDFESDRWLPGDRYLKRLVRPVYNRFNRRQKVTGFQMAFRLLVEALRLRGYDVRQNDYAAARRNPEHPVGLFGYPHLLEGWDLPNPTVLGPGLFDHPSLAPDLMKDGRNRFYLVCSEWMRSMFARTYEDSCVVWFNGIDISQWPDTRGQAKDVDVLVYDKIRWDREKYEPELLDPVPASSVPYFSPECGDRFRDFAGFDAALDRFWPRLDAYDPRAYVARELSLERSADLYMSYYRRAAPTPLVTSLPLPRSAFY